MSVPPTTTQPQKGACRAFLEGKAHRKSNVVDEDVWGDRSAAALLQDASLNKKGVEAKVDLTRLVGYLEEPQKVVEPRASFEVSPYAMQDMSECYAISSHLSDEDSNLSVDCSRKTVVD